MNYLHSILSRLSGRFDRGATMVEYALVVSLVATGSLGTFEMMDAEIEEHYEESAGDIGEPDLSSFEAVTTTTTPSSTTSTTTTAAPTTTTSTTTTTTTTAAPTTTTTAPPTTTTLPTSLAQDADDAVATGGFASDGNGQGNTNGSGDNWDGADATDSSLTFTFNVTTAGEYKILGSVKAPSGSSNSFWVTVDGEPGDGYLWDTTQSGSYTNDYVSDRNGADPVTIWLEPGEHTVSLHLREDGTYAESLELVAI